MFIVLIEWDGRKPPTTFYNRMHALGLRVHGDHDISVLDRRAVLGKNEGSVVLQEGAIMCAEESLAREVAMIATTLNAKVVKIGTIEPTFFTATTEDVKVHDRIEALCGKKGRPSVSEEPQRYTVMCLSEMKSYTVDDVRFVANCPKCGSLHIKTFIGDVHGYRWPDGENFASWQRVRFAEGQFGVYPDGVLDPPLSVTATNSFESKILELIKKSFKFLTTINKMPVATAKSVLDAVFASRLYSSYELRKTSRVEASVYLLQNNRAAPGSFDIGEDDFRVDILDASSVLGGQVAAQIWLASQNLA